MTLETSLSNIIVRNNKISHQRGTTYGTFTSPIVNYSHCARIAGSAQIEGNTFISPTGTAGTVDMLNLVDGSSIVQGNKFIRDSLSINSYIRQYGTGEHLITNNIFDHSTIDGTNDQLTANLSASSHYHNNKNQVLYIAVPLFNSGFRVNTTNDISNPNNVNDSFIYDTNISDPDAIEPTNGYRPFTHMFLNAGLRLQHYYINLNSVLPKNIRVLEAKFGFSASGNQVTSPSTITTHLASKDIGVSNYATGTNSILDGANQEFLANEIINSSYDVNANITALNTATQYITVTAGSDNFLANNNNSIGIGMTFSITVNSGNQVEFVMSPIVLKCKW